MSVTASTVDLSVTELFHAGFRRDLEAFARAVRGTPVGEGATWERLACRWDLLVEVVHHHQVGERTGLWPWLEQHCTPDERPVLRALHEGADRVEHELAGCAVLLVRMAGRPDADTRAALVVRVGAARATLLAHLAREEDEGFAVLRRRMTVQEWRRVDDEHFRPAITPAYALRLVPWAASGASRSALAPVFSEAGTAFRWVWLLTRRRFARHEARTFRYA